MQFTDGSKSKMFILEENDVSFHVRGAIFEVYKTLGPGLFESVYQSAMAYELTNKGLKVLMQHPIPVSYKEEILELGFKADLLVEEKVIVEIKSVESLQKVHHKQLITYLKLTGVKLGLLVNFNTSDISSDIRRLVNGL